MAYPALVSSQSLNAGLTATRLAFFLRLFILLVHIKT